MNRKTRAQRLALAAAVAGVLTAAVAVADADADHPAQHVVLISVDGLHQADLQWYVSTHPGSTLAKLVHNGVSYTNARTPFPSGSFPGMVGQVTGGNPKTTGIYYDDAYSRALLPPGTTNCSNHPALGAEVYYAEVVDFNFDRLDGGANIPGLYSDFSKILTLTGNPITLINPALLPVDPATCKPVYPHRYLLVNTLFEVLKAHGRHTAWSYKHAAYEILSGPSGKGIDDLFAPEINSSVTDPSLPAGPGDDFTKNNINTQIYDSLKVRAVLNWAHGLDHSGATKQSVPAIFGMNFQTVSTAQKLITSQYYGVYGQPSTKACGLGGYTNAGMVPGNVLAGALDYIDAQMAKIVGAIDPKDTVVMLSAKHGQSPQDRAALTIVNDGTMIDALNAAWDPKLATDGKLPLVAHAIDDDGVLMWLNYRTEEAFAFTKHFLANYSGTGIGSDPAGNKIAKAFTSAGLQPHRIYVGEEAADFVGVKPGNSRVPDVIGVAQYGTVWAGGKLSKIAEHGGDGVHDRHVPIVIWGPGIGHRRVDERAETTQIAPTILRLLGYSPNELQAVRAEGTETLPELRGDD